MGKSHRQLGPSVGVRPRFTFTRVQWKRGREGKGEGDDTPAAGRECGGATADGGGVANGGGRRVAREREPSHLGGTVQVLAGFVPDFAWSGTLCSCASLVPTAFASSI